MPGPATPVQIDRRWRASERSAMRTALVLVALAPTLAAADEPPGSVQTGEPAPTSPSPARPDPADGGGSYFAAPKGHDIVVTSQDDRSTQNVALLATLGGAGLILGGTGVYFHLDAHSKSQDVS